MHRNRGSFCVGLIDGSPAQQGAHRQSTFDRTGDHTGHEAQKRANTARALLFSKVRP